MIAKGQPNKLNLIDAAEGVEMDVNTSGTVKGKAGGKEVPLMAEYDEKPTQAEGEDFM